MKYPLYIEQFRNDLQIMLVKALKTAIGSCIKRGKLTISPKVEKYLQNRFHITKRLQKSNILDILDLDQKIVKNEVDVDFSVIIDFKVKFGNDSVLNYVTRKSNSNSFRKTLKISRIVHWEFFRNIDMAENHDGTAIDALDARFNARTSEWRARFVK
jgi:hypothetical protein